MILGLACWALAPAAVFGQDEPAPSPQQKAQQEIARADAAVRRVQQLRQHPDFGEASRRDGEELESSLERARRLLAAARSGLESAAQTQSDTGFGDAALLARRAARELDAYEEHLRGLFRQIEEERSPPPSPPEEEAGQEPPGPAEASAAAEAAEAPVAEPGVEASPAQPPSAQPPPAPAQPPSAQPPSAAEPIPSEPPATEPTVQPTVEPSPPVVAPPPPARRTPPRQLRQAADAYFAGDYEQTVALLTEAKFKAAKARAHALLLRAAARYALFLLGGDTDYALRGLATEDVAACRRADPALAPSEEMFSPRFRDFFAATR